MWEAGGVAACLVLGANIALRPVANRLNQRVQSGNEVASYYTISVLCDVAGAPAVRASLMKAMAQHHVPPRQFTSEDGPADGETKITVRVDVTHVVDDTVEKLLGEIAQSASVRGTSWQVARAAPEA
jgi:uncharacterized membrane protein YhiD involved in acid resistance